jgi:malonyl-CoA/methylmalonyl-CoA synthetase
MSQTLSQLFASTLKAAPDAPFIVSPGGETLSYRAAAELSGRFANALSKLGVGPGDRIAAQIPKCRDALLLYLAAMRAGAVYVPLNTGYTAPELDYFLADARPSVLVCASNAREELEPSARANDVDHVLTLGPEGEGTLQILAAESSPNLDDALRTGDDTAAILYTSGTTGRSKGAMLSHTNLVSNAHTLAEIWHFEASDRLLHALPIYHTHGLFTATNTVIASGASMILLPGFDAEQVVDALPQASVFMGVPTYYIRLLQCARFDKASAANMRLFISGSAPLSPDTHNQFAERTGHAVLERYGMTETNMNTSNPYDGARLAGSVGLPLPGVELRIVDDGTGAQCGAGMVGVIEVRGPNVFAGYWGKEELTASEFRDDGFFVTGDLGRVDESGYVWIEGRQKDLIISGGLNVYPAEIESAIDAIAGVRESAVIGVPHPDFGEGVTAVVACEDDAALDERAVAEALAAGLAKFKQPKRIYFVETLPRNAMGKIQKNLLRETYRHTYLKD